MKIKSFRIKNYKSVIDSGICLLSENDNICMMAGQNESGKSSILQALFDYSRDRLRDDCLREFKDEFDYPIIYCTYKIEKSDELTEKLLVPDYLKNKISKLKEIEVIREFSSKKDSSINFGEEISRELIDIIKKNQNDSYTSMTNESEDIESQVDLEADGPEGKVSESEDGGAKEIKEALEIIKSKGKKPEVIEKEALNTLNGIVDNFVKLIPKTIFLDDFCDLLPERIMISDLKNNNEKANGYKAVKNIENILEEDLTKLDQFSDAVSKSKEESYTRRITANFNERWKQKIYETNEVQICIQYLQGRKDSAGSYLNFFIETKVGEPLPFERRSKGLQWFLSFYLQLTAESKSTEDLA